VQRYYLALGDSITAGYGVGGSNFATLYYSYLVNRYPYLRYINYGILGLTTYRLAIMLSSNASLQNMVAQAEVITITIGSNDLLQVAASFLRGGRLEIFRALIEMEKNVNFIGMQIRKLKPTALVKVATIYNPLPAGPYYQYTAEAQKIITQANKIIVHGAKRYGFHVIPVDKMFRGKEHLVIGQDYLHPNLAGHQMMATE